ncbi:exonuclease 1 isoform X2 [Syngnathus typhle]|uniref:exonuclease 1 isoform X2 n=1 Tax=Syngnathus typhle TaxID=161592 RepID=UPI002A6ABC3C|nr:exonuclease 1 isoform X2 [Syngnathus typhle]
MGIPGLLQFIKDAGEPVNVKKYKGQTVAVDTYCWLHKGAFSCAEKLAKGEPTDQYVRFCMKYVDMLFAFNVKPILVFDGRNLPSKGEVEKARRERREVNLHKGRQLLREGKLSEARDCFTRCVNITPDMAHHVIKAARARGVDCLVAPYEADAQLAYLTKCGLAHAVITEDSDLLAFGCQRVILKMDKQGNGLEIDQRNLGRCRSLGNVFTEEKFRYMCILSGCDYLASLHGIGLGKACKLLRLAKDSDIRKVIKKMGQYLKMDLVVPEEYMDGFVRANQTFLYQLVFDPVSRKMVPLNPYEEDIDPATLSYAGAPIREDKALQMALGNLDINTMEKIDDFNPDNPMTPPAKHRSRSWNESSVPRPAGLSIWRRSIKAPWVGAAHPAASPDGPPPSTRGQERITSLTPVRLPCTSVQVKRAPPQAVYQIKMCCGSIPPLRSDTSQTRSQKRSSRQPWLGRGHATALPQSCRGGTRMTRIRTRSCAADSSAVPVQLPATERNLLRWVSLIVRRSPKSQALRPPIPTAQKARRLWKRPAHLVRAVRGSGCLTGQTLCPSLIRHRHSNRVQAWLPCSTSSIRRTRRPNPLFAESPKGRKSSKALLLPRTAAIFLNPSLPLRHATKTKEPTVAPSPSVLCLEWIQKSASRLPRAQATPVVHLERYAQRVQQVCQSPS